VAKTENDSEKQESAPKGAGSPASGGDRDAARDRTIRILEEMNRKLLARVKELELKHSGGAEQPGGGAAEEAEGDKRISTMVKGLRGDIDAAYVLKKALETDLVETQKRLSEEEAARRQFESRAGILEAKATLADQLRHDISFVEEEQNRTFRRLEDVTSQLKRVTEERNKFAGASKARDGRIAELLRQRFELEADVVELKERLEEMVSFFSEKSRSPSRDARPGGEKKGGAG
jgi:chromosome segregation ATPase